MVAQLPCSIKKAGIALLVSLGLPIIGTSVCFPGIYGCVGWLPITVPDGLQDVFMTITIAGAVGIAVSTIWLGLAAVVGLIQTLPTRA